MADHNDPNSVNSIFSDVGDRSAPLGNCGYPVETMDDQAFWDAAPITPKTSPNPTAFPHLAEPW